jgi:hypothetical protein
MFRSAYFQFKSIVDAVGVYKNSIDLMNKSLQEAKLTIAIAPFKSSYASYSSLATQVKNKLVSGISKIESPLYEVVAAPSFESNPFSRKAFQYDRSRGVVNSKTTYNAKALIEGTVQNYHKRSGILVKKEKHAYLKRTVEYIDKQTKVKKKRTVYDKVKYYEYALQRKVSLILHYSMKRLDRDEIILSDTFNKEEMDQIKYAEFKGDYKRLVPGEWKSISKKSEDDRVYDNANAVKKLRADFTARKQAKSLSELENALIEKCVSKITSQVENYKPEN